MTGSEKPSIDCGDDAPGFNSGGKLRHPLIGCLKGMITIAPGVDLTERPCPELAEWIEEKYGNGQPCDEQ